jgi:hypothetical protein
MVDPPMLHCVYKQCLDASVCTTLIYCSVPRKNLSSSHPQLYLLQLQYETCRQYSLSAFHPHRCTEGYLHTEAVHLSAPTPAAVRTDGLNECSALQGPVFRIHEILVRNRIRGSMPLTNGSGFRFGSGSGSRVRTRIQDPDPAVFVIDLQDANKNKFKKKFCCLLLFEVHLHHFSKIKSPKEVTKQ